MPRYSYRSVPGGRRVKVAESVPHPGADATVAAILEWAGSDVSRARRAESVELTTRGPAARSTLLAKLRGIIGE